MAVARVMLSGGGFWCSALGNINDQCFIHGLSARVKVIQSATHRFLRAKDPLIGALSTRRVSRNEFYSDIWGIESAAKGIVVFFQDSIAQIIHQIFLCDRNQGSG